MSKKNKNLCQTQDRLSKKTLLAYIGITDIDFSSKEYESSSFNNAFANGKICRANSIPDTANNIQKLFYRMCLEDWDITSYDATTGEVCILLNNSRGNNVISININKKN